MKTVVVSFNGINGNAFSLLGRWQEAARSQGLAADEIDQVIQEATSGDYGHLLRTLLRRSTEPAAQ